MKGRASNGGAPVSRAIHEAAPTIGTPIGSASLLPYLPYPSVPRERPHPMSSSGLQSTAFILLVALTLYVAFLGTA